MFTSMTQLFQVLSEAVFEMNYGYSANVLQKIKKSGRNPKISA